MNSAPASSRMPSAIRARSRRAAPASLALLTLALALPSASAATLYWGQAAYTGNVATAANWFTDAAGTNVSSVAPHATNATDDLFFNTTPANTVGGTVAVDSNFSANSLTFNTSGATVLSQGSNARTLILGGGGITLNGIGNVNFGTSTNNLNVRLTTSQTWTNNSSGTLNVRIPTTNPGAGAVALTLNAAGSGNITLPLAINDTAANPLSLVIDSAGSGTVGLAAATGVNAYRGGTTINRGLVTTTGTLGTGDVLLGNTTGGANASFTVNSTAFANNLTVRSGGTGTRTLTTSNAAGALSGAVTLDGDLALSATGALTTFSGAISGAGDIVKSGNGALVFSGANTSSGDLTINAGAFTLAQTGSLTFHIDANGDANQVNGSTLGAITFNGTFEIDLSEAVLDGPDSWTLVSFAATAIYGENFSVAGFSSLPDNIWTNNAGLTFSEITGVLSYSAVPEPSSFALFAGVGTLALALGRRRTPRTPAAA